MTQRHRYIIITHDIPILTHDYSVDHMVQLRVRGLKAGITGRTRLADVRVLVPWCQNWQDWS